MNILIFGALLAIAIGLAKVVRRMDTLQALVQHGTAETNVEASATRLYLGRLSGRDPGLKS